MSEVPFFFDSTGPALFGVLHNAPCSGPPVGFVLCHPFGEEKLWAHRVFVNFARELAKRGFPVLRFDYRGNGDSTGKFSDSSVSTGLSDLQRAIDTLKRHTGVQSTGLVGLRFGAALASRVAEERSDVGPLVLWAPIVDGSRYVQELLRINVTTQMSVYREVRHDRAALIDQLKAGRTANVDGYELSLDMFDELSELNLSAGPKRYAGRALVVQIDRAADARPLPDLTDLARQYENASLAVVQEHPFWREIDQFYDHAPNLFTRTLDWLSNS